MIGTTVLHYAIDSRLGEGGMGTVYRARDTVLNRTVALKVLHAGDLESTRRLLHEARSASALNHPNSVTIHAVEQHGDLAFIVMEHVAGVPLDQAIPADGFPIDRALRYALEISGALAAAHAQGIIHRDLKPANVMLTPDDRVKVLDFGIARRTSLPDEATRMQTMETLGGPGVLIGTAGYMAPEQIEGKPATERSDVFALGALIYELLAGSSPFRRDTAWTSIDATMRHTPPPLTEVRPDVPPSLAAFVARCLSKDPAARPASADEVHRELTAIQRQRPPASAPSSSWYRRAAVAGLTVIVLASIAAFAWSRVGESRLRWVRDTAIPEIERLNLSSEPVEAYRLAQRARATVPQDPQVEAAWRRFTIEFPLTSTPAGAEVSIRSLSGKDEGWIVLGKTPTTAVIPVGQMRWRYRLEGYDDLEIVVSDPFPFNPALVRTGAAPAGMVLVSAGSYESPTRRGRVTLPEFWLDRHEVTNKEFKAFIDNGGYTQREYWREPFVIRGRTLTWEDAMTAFRDPTGRPGPSTWELGGFPDGQGDWPVHGVSWYEAAAYAAWSGKSLPTAFHWYRASGASGIFSDILRFSNFGGTGPVRVGSAGSLGPFGTYDMPGNVKEWVWNQSADGRRYNFGGDWRSPPYQFHGLDGADPFERPAGMGFRCMRQAEPIAANLANPIERSNRDPSDLKPVSDEVYGFHRALYDYDQKPLDARTDEVSDTSPHWRFERVSFSAAYGNERVPLMLFLPRGAKPPYQVVIYFPGSDAVRTQNSSSAYTLLVDFLPRSGRALAFPVYQQTYERRRQPTGPNFVREYAIQRVLDTRRTVDYLETRPDIDKSKIAYYGLSLGATVGPIHLAVEPRIRTGILLSGGFGSTRPASEIDAVNFAPRVTQPVLMVNGREDFDLPYETAQLGMFNLLGTKPPDKQHLVLAGGHLPPKPVEIFKAALEWLDRYFGPVNR